MLRTLFKWTLRLLLLAGVVWVLLLPWSHEVVGACRIIPISQHGVRAAVAGEILEVAVRQGDQVEGGSLIAVLDDREYRTGLLTAQADLERHSAELDLLLAGARKEEVAIARETQELWRIRLQHNEAELERLAELVRKNAGTSKDVEAARLARDEATHQLAGARERLALLEAGAREEEVRAKRALIKVAQTSIDHYTRAIELTQVRTPVAGLVVTPFMEERKGQIATAGELLAVVQDQSSLQVEVRADESAGALAKLGMDVGIRLDGLDGELLTGRVLALGPTTSTESELGVEPVRSDREAQLEKGPGVRDPSLVRVLCSLDETDHHLVPGMTGYARIKIGESFLWREIWRPVERFFRTDVWSWLP